VAWFEEQPRLQRLARTIEPTARLETKDGWLWRAMARALPLVTLGGISRRAFLEDYATTIGPLQGYPRAWDAAAVERLLVHEARHTRQARWFALGLHPWLGVPLMGVAYLLLPLPLGLAYVRYRLELDADAADWRHRLARGAGADEIRSRARQLAERVASGHYGWAWPRRWALRGFARAAERALARARRGGERGSEQLD